MRWSRGPHQHNWPLLALSYNHRRQAFYDAYKEQPQNPQVQATLKNGIKRARILHKDTPNFVVEWLCSEHNLHHTGSGETPLGIVDKALKAEASWKRKCSNEGITSRHPQYQQNYDAFVRSEAPLFKDSITLFQDAKSLGHTLGANNLIKEFEDGCSGMATGCYGVMVLGGKGKVNQYCIFLSMLLSKLNHPW